MKRFLLLFCAVALACSIMIVPAMAIDATYLERVDIGKDGFGCAVVPVPGQQYFIELWDLDETLLISFSVVWPEEETCFTFNSDDSLFSITGCCHFWDGLYESDLFVYRNGAVYSSCVLYIYEFVSESDSEVTPLGSIFDVFGGIGSWISGQLGVTTSLFWNGQGLTFLGVLSVSGLALAVVLLLVMVVVRFLRFRS